MIHEIKAHHVAIFAVCTIVVFVMSFELGARVHRRKAPIPPAYRSSSSLNPRDALAAVGRLVRL
jgi:hypothetical protein